MKVEGRGTDLTGKTGVVEGDDGTGCCLQLLIERGLWGVCFGCGRGLLGYLLFLGHEVAPEYP